MKNYTLKLEFNTTIDNDNFKQITDNRYQEFSITIKSKTLTKNELSDIYYNIAEKLENELKYYNVSCARCPTYDKYNNVNSYIDTFVYNASYGEVKEVKQEIKEIYKTIKNKLFKELE